MNYLETIKRILDSDAGLIIEDMSHSTNKKVIDNRFNLIKQSIERVDNKDDFFYTELIKLISYYINQLYQISDEKSLVSHRFIFTKKAQEFSIYVDQNKTQLKCYLILYTNYQLNKAFFCDLF